MSVNVGEICENTKMGREYALLGNYETAMVYYQGVLQQIQKLLVTISDTTRKQKWQQVFIHNCLQTKAENWYSTRLLVKCFSNLI